MFGDATILSGLESETPHHAGLPVLLVDIDGVLSVWGASRSEPVDGFWTLVDGIPHFLAAGPAARLRELREGFELVWCSGWEERANEHLPSLLGIGPLPHVRFDGRGPDSARAGHWKLAAIDDHVGPDAAVAWVDDALNAACHAWARARSGPTLLVETDPAVGLTPAQAGELAGWAAGLRGAETG